MGETFHDVGKSYRTAPFPNWNDTVAGSSLALELNSFKKPSSNTLNVGAPTFQPAAHSFRGAALQNTAEAMPVKGKSSDLKGLSYSSAVSQ
jgi:hypothetical protein